MRFAKILSHGNKAAMTDHEILDYFTHDSETGVLCLFLESVSDGRAFYESLAQTTLKKPAQLFSQRQLNSHSLREQMTSKYI